MNAGNHTLQRWIVRLVQSTLLFILATGLVFGATTSKKAKRVSPVKYRVKKVHAARRVVKRAVTRAEVHPTRRLVHRRSRRVYDVWTEPTYADSTVGDFVDGEDLDVRLAAVEALGPLNGSVVVVEPNSGRILTMVNQKLALSGGFQPCSTIKIPIALAALNEGLIERTSLVRLYGRTKMDLTEAIAHSNNFYFANLGVKLGFQRVSYYARMFGLGEKAGLDIAGEQPGRFPSEPPANGGVGMLTSFGEDISLTPLQLAAIMSSVANNGTLYYLQYPRSQEEAQHLIPRVKRQLEIQRWIPEVKPGMQGAVDFGTARRAFHTTDSPMFGKTGTCSERNTHLGWFGSFNDVGRNKLVVVVLLTGGRPSVGPMAAWVAGEVYRHLSEKNYFASAQLITPGALISAAQ